MSHVFGLTNMAVRATKVLSHNNASIRSWGQNQAHTQSNSPEIWPALVDTSLASRGACLKKAFPNIIRKCGQ